MFEIKKRVRVLPVKIRLFFDVDQISAFQSTIHYESFANNVVEGQDHLLIYVALKIFA